MESNTSTVDPVMSSPFFRLTVESHQQLFENAPDAMVVCNAEECIVAANVLTERLFGYQREELIGSSLEKLIPQRFRDSHIHHRQGYIAKPAYRSMSTSHDTWGLKKDGSEVPVEISLNAVESAEANLVFAIIRDRSEWIAAWGLKEQAEFEKTVSSLSTTFINLPYNRVDEELTNGLKALAHLLSGERCTIALLDADSQDFLVSHAWSEEGILTVPKRFVRSMFPWLAERILNGETVLLKRAVDLPPEAQLEKSYMKSLGIKSFLAVPLRVGGTVVGGISCDSLRNHQPWDAVTASRLQAGADVFANALIRKQADEKLQRAYAEIQRLKEQLEQENSYLREEINLEYSHNTVVGNSAAIRSVLKKAEQVAGTDSTVLVLGETGTGKELIARIIHEMSGRNKRPMVKTNCAALPATLIESELFGREKGAYTGALAREIGRFELADQSTIFLDEIGELPPEVQSKLLRVLQEGEFERLGSSRTIQVNVRVIAATSRDLEKMVREGKFREDLFYRLNVFPILIPPLRERPEDIPALVWQFLKELGKRMGRNVQAVQASTMQEFQRHPWLGNVRELRNVIERNLILNTGPVFRAEIPRIEHKAHHTMRPLHEIESEYLRNVLGTTRWRIRGKGGAAEILAIKPTTLEARLKKLNIRRPA
jgi:formate hydrogenlyase transcriptional activator